MEQKEEKNKLKLFGATLWIVGTVAAVWFGSTFESHSLPMVAGERSLCAFGMLISAFAAGCLSLGFSQGFDGSEVWDWMAMITLAAGLILIGLGLGDSTILGGSISDAVAVIGGGMVGVATPHRRTA